MAGAKNRYETYVQPRLEEIKTWCEEGLIELEISKRLGISITTLQSYKKQHEELKEALKAGRSVSDYKVENSLFKRATGYQYTEVTKERVLNKITNEYENVITKEVTKEVAPETAAIIFWLKNRCPQKWRDKVTLEGSIDINNKFTNLSDDEIAAEIKKMELVLNATKNAE